MGIIIYALFPSHSLSVSLPFSLSRVRRQLYFIFILMLLFLFSLPMLIRCVYVFFVQLIQALGEGQATPAETVAEPGLWQGVAVGEGEGAGDSVQRTNGKKAMLKGRE